MGGCAPLLPVFCMSRCLPLSLSVVELYAQATSTSLRIPCYTRASDLPLVPERKQSTSGSRSARERIDSKLCCTNSCKCRSLILTQFHPTRPQSALAEMGTQVPTVSQAQIFRAQTKHAPGSVQTVESHQPFKHCQGIQ